MSNSSAASEGQPEHSLLQAALLPLFLKLGGRRVVLVGGGRVATAKAGGLAEAGARLVVVSPVLTPALDLLVERHRAALGWSVERREFQAADLEGAWLVIAAAPPAVNRAVAASAETGRVFVVAVDDPSAASAYGAGTLRRAGVTVAISTSGEAPSLAGLLREGLEAVLPEDLDLGAWLAEARRLRPAWRAEGVAHADRRPRLLKALNELYARKEIKDG